MSTEVPATAQINLAGRLVQHARLVLDQEDPDIASQYMAGLLVVLAGLVRRGELSQQACESLLHPYERSDLMVSGLEYLWFDDIDLLSKFAALRGQWVREDSRY